MKTCFVPLLFALFLASLSFTAQAQTSALYPAAIYSDTPLALASDASARAVSVLDRPPPLSGGQRVKQVATGTLAGAAAGLLGGFVGAALSGCESDRDFGDFLCGLEAAALGVLVGEAIGAAVSVYQVGRTAETTGSLGFTLLGSVVGLGAGSLLAGVINTDFISVPLFLLGAPVGATLANNLIRRYRTPSQQSSLLNLDRHGLYIGVPAVSITHLADRTSARSIRLLTASW